MLLVKQQLLNALAERAWDVLEAKTQELANMCQALAILRCREKSLLRAMANCLLQDQRPEARHLSSTS